MKRSVEQPSAQAEPRTAGRVGALSFSRLLPLVPWPAWVLLAGLAVTLGPTGLRGAALDLVRDRSADLPAYLARLAPGERATLGDVTVVNVSRPPAEVSVEVSVVGPTLTVRVPNGYSGGMGSREGLAGNCGNVDGRSHTFRCDIKPGSLVEVKALKVTTATPDAGATPPRDRPLSP